MVMYRRKFGRRETPV